MGLTRRGVLGTATAALSGCLGSATRRSADECVGTPDARIGFAGDAMLGRGVNRRWRDGPPAGVWGRTRRRFESLDGLFLNLECSLSGRSRPRPGLTFHFRAAPGWAVPALAAADTAFVSLANNHQLDYGPAALVDTLDHLSAAGIGHAGAGVDLGAALRPAVVDAGGATVAVIALTDRSPADAAGADDPGTAYASLDPLDPRTRRLVADALGRAREHDPALVVASLHWGPNWEPRPAQRQRTFGRWLIDRGVDVVHGHSAHVLQGLEVYRGRPVIYDAGDVVDDYAIKPGLHNDRSVLFELALVDGRPDAIRLVPVEIVDETVQPAGETAARWLRERMRALSAPFGTAFERAGAGLRVSLAGC